MELLRWAFIVYVVWWEYTAISHHANRMPTAVFEGNHEPMNADCVSIYFALQRSLLVTLFNGVIQPLFLCCVGVMTVLLAAEGQIAWVQFCSALMAFGVWTVMIAMAFNFIIHVMGIYAVLSAKTESVAECNELYECGSYVFVWLLVFNMCVDCCRQVGTIREVVLPGPLPDHYGTLEVPVDADETTIRQAYKKLALAWHPDKHMGDDRAEAEKRMRAINAAYEELGNKEKRARYDSMREAERLYAPQSERYSA